MKDYFNKGDHVNVKACAGDMFNNDFTGTVVGRNDDFVTVRDQDGDCWDCDEKQLSLRYSNE
jgi:hypothetical protein